MKNFNVVMLSMMFTACAWNSQSVREELDPTTGQLRVASREQESNNIAPDPFNLNKQKAADANATNTLAEVCKDMNGTKATMLSESDRAVIAAALKQQPRLNCGVGYIQTGNGGFNYFPGNGGAGVPVMFNGGMSSIMNEYPDAQFGGVMPVSRQSVGAMQRQQFRLTEAEQKTASMLDKLTAADKAELDRLRDARAACEADPRITPSDKCQTDIKAHENFLEKIKRREVLKQKDADKLTQQPQGQSAGTPENKALSAAPGNGIGTQVALNNGGPQKEFGTAAQIK